MQRRWDRVGNRVHRHAKRTHRKIPKSQQSGNGENRQSDWKGGRLHGLERGGGRLCAGVFNSGEKMVRLADLLRQLNRVKILLAGDLVLDQYTHGKTERISPEAPVLVVHVK